MFTKPIQFHEFLSHHGLIEEVYNAMASSDLSSPVTTVLRILQNTNKLPPLVKERKSETKSTAYRNEGNQAFRNKNHQSALFCYNLALLYAPKHSRSMKLAYSNRSALLFKMNSFSACLNDIETCFSMECPMDIIEKLRNRREEAKNSLWMEKLYKSTMFDAFSEEFFEMNVQRNPQIPCASTDVGVIVENRVPKIVATKDIKVGTVLAVETAFVSQSDSKNAVFSCYYCHKMSLNLKPCDGCCLVLFCNEECRQTCLKMYHSTECKIIEVLETISCGTMTRLVVKAALKIKYMSKSWKELHSATFSMGMDRLKTSSINEIYDSNSKFSLLCIKDQRHFLNGPLYNASFICAAIIHYFDTIEGFFPQTNWGDKGVAIRTMARLLMFLSLYPMHIKMILCVSVYEKDKTEYYDIPNFGWFSFLGKLKNSCQPNVLAVGLNKKVALLAVTPIKKGTELTMSYVGHWLDTIYEKDIRNRNMFMLYGIACNCIVCTGEFKTFNSRLTDKQKKYFNKLNVEQMIDGFSQKNVPDFYPKTCKALAFLSDLPYSDEYQQVYRLFRRCLLYFQTVSTDNVMFDHIEVVVQKH